MLSTQWAEGVAGLSDGEFWIICLLLGGLAVAGFYGIFRFIHRLRIIEDTPTSKIRSAVQGYVELIGHGELMPGTPIIAPLTGTPCTWYSYKIEEKVEHYDSRGGRHTRWRTLQSGISDELFYLKDDTGECIIDPEGAEVTPGKSDVWYGNTPTWSHNLPSSRGGLFNMGRYRYTEKRMHPTEPLYAIGLFKSVGGAQELPNTQEDVRRLLNQWKQNQSGLLKHFDTNGDGQIDLHEWEQVRKVARKVILKQQAERMQGPVNHLLAKPEDSRRPFILSVLPQEGMARRYRWMAAGSFALFLLGGALLTFMLNARLAP